MFSRFQDCSHRILTILGAWKVRAGDTFWKQCVGLDQVRYRIGTAFVIRF